MKHIRFALILALMTLFFVAGVIANPYNVFGAQNTQINTSRLAPYNASNHSAYAGNVTELNIYGYSVTRAWQGYFGNVTGVITLSDSASNVMYNWSVTSPRGQVYASTNGSGITWTQLQCFNYTALGSFASDAAQAGNTSLNGMNLTQLQAMFNINSSGFNGSIKSSRDEDSVDRTFTYRSDGADSDGRGHRLFYANYLQFDEGECWATRIYGPGGAQTIDIFEQVLMYEPESKSVVFTSLLNEDVLGFDGRHHDFQMLVLEDGHGTNTATTTYYFYIELA